MTEQAERLGSMTELGRIAGVFWKPRRVFEDLAERPRWWAPLIILTVLSMVFTATEARFGGYVRSSRQVVQSVDTAAWMPAGQREQFLAEAQPKVGSIMDYVSAAYGSAEWALIASAVLLGFFNLLGRAKLKYRQAFSVTCYSLLPMGLWMISNIVVAFVGTPALLVSFVLLMFLSGLWGMLLTGLGLRIASKKLTFGKSLMLVVLSSAVFSLLQRALMAMFSYV
jgi:hypothetical protein